VESHQGVRALSCPVLKTSRDGDRTASPGSLLDCLQGEKITLSLNPVSTHMCCLLSSHQALPGSISSMLTGTAKLPLGQSLLFSRLNEPRSLPLRQVLQSPTTSVALCSICSSSTESLLQLPPPWMQYARCGQGAEYPLNLVIQTAFYPSSCLFVQTTVCYLGMRALWESLLK